MKRKIIITTTIIIVIIAFIIISLFFIPPKISQTVNLEKQFYTNGKEVNLGNKSKYGFSFSVPEEGKLSLIIFDAIGNIDNEENSKLTVLIKDKDNKAVAKKSCRINELCDILMPVNKGEYKVFVNLKNHNNEKRLSVSWAFSANKATNVGIDKGTSTALTDKNGLAEFNINVDKNMLVEVSGGDACLPECSFTFSVTDENGNKVVKDTKIHETEWYKRKVYLPKGKYKIEMTGLTANSVAECKITSVKDYENIIYNRADNPSDVFVTKANPVTLGFAENLFQTQLFKFNADRKSKELSITLDGNDTYYDHICTAKIMIIKNGKVLADEICEEDFVLDISKLNGSYLVFITPKSNNNLIAKAQMK